MSMEYPSLDSPTAGAIRFNTDSGTLEIYVDAEWHNILAVSYTHLTLPTTPYV